MNVLCLFGDAETHFIASDPAAELGGHDVECVSTYNEAKALLQRPTKPVDVILADISIPLRDGSEKLMPIPMLVPYFAGAGVKGFGVFLPQRFTTSDAIPQGDEYAIVSSKECVTADEKRDWKKLFALVKAQMH
ncbi:MAG: hypothetical protein Q7R93_01845 [bacterium]|nr:hypothetical protein [bacterium]